MHEGFFFNTEVFCLHEGFFFFFYTEEFFEKTKGFFSFKKKHKGISF